MFRDECEKLAETMITPSSFVDDDTGKTLHALCLNNIDGDTLMADTSCTDEAQLSNCMLTTRRRLADVLEHFAKRLDHLSIY